MYKHPRFISEVPTTTEPQIGDIRLSDYLLEHPAVSMLHTMPDVSMRDFGILSGDTLIVEKGRVPKDGDLVMGEIDGRYLIRAFRKFSGGVSLYAGHPDYAHLAPEESLQILGVVSASLRKYK